MRLCPVAYLKLFPIIIISFLFFGCETSVRKRPPGYLKLGKVSDFLVPESKLNQQKLILRYDAKGFSVMSTMCTHDLTYLVRKNINGRDLLVSEYTSSQYDMTGGVVSGPAVGNLPYYELKIEPGVYGGPKDTLYVYVGKEVPSDWRLELNLSVPNSPNSGKQ